MQRSVFSMAQTRRILSLTTCFFLLVFSGLAQPGRRYHTENKRAIKAYEKAMELSVAAMGPGADRAALQLEVEGQIAKALELDPGFAEAERVRGALLMEKGEFNEAKAVYAKVLKAHGEVWIRDHFAWAEAARWSLDPASMQQAMESMVRIPGVLQGPDTARIEAMMADASFMKGALANPEEVNIEAMPFPISTPEDEYFPSVWQSGNGLVFTRRITDGHANTGNRKLGQEDLFVTIKQDGEWSVPSSMRGLNTRSNEGAASLSGDGTSVILTVCRDADRSGSRNPAGPRDRHKGSCDLYGSSLMANGVWERPQNLGAVNTSGWESQPCLSPDGSKLYFTRGSGKPGRRQHDLFSSQRQADGTWSSPRKMQGAINTAGKEMRPFIHPDGRHFYFATNGRAGMGGMDLFVSTLDEDGEWGSPVNLGWPINTPGEESGLVVSSDGRTAFFSRESGGQLDVFTFELPASVSASPTLAMEGLLRSENGAPLPSGRVSLLDPATGEVFAEGRVNLKGHYHVPVPTLRSFVVSAEAPDHLVLSERIEAGSSDWLEHDLVLRPLSLGAEVVLQNVFFDSGSAQLSPESQTELHQIASWLRSQPQITLEVGGHTDDVGGESSNQQLSKERALAVRGTLIELGASPEQLTAVGYGNSQPAQIGDSEMARRLNRRTTLTVRSLD